MEESLSKAVRNNIVVTIVFPDVLWVPPAHFESFCKLDMRYWPVDKQSCKLKFGSWTSHGEDISLDLYDNNTKVDFEDYP